uniref:Putative secreted protein n=1 Tax=Anopheles marajoara TaxID=58244 RepID=A0A2M4C8E7_9DIPT
MKKSTTMMILMLVVADAADVVAVGMLETVKRRILAVVTATLTSRHLRMSTFYFSSSSPACAVAQSVVSVALPVRGTLHSAGEDESSPCSSSRPFPPRRSHEC